MTGGLEGRVALVTGSSRGIGAAIARELAARGALVAVNYRRREADADKVVAEIEAAGGRALAVGADVTSKAEVQEMVKRVGEELGPIGILVLNAHGFDESIRDFPLDVDVEDLAGIVSGQIRAALLAVQACVPGMVERGSGSVVMISALQARDPWIRSITHGTAKAAMEAIAKFLARYLAPDGVRVNTAIAGVTRTESSAQIRPERLAAAVEMVPMKRMGEPEDIARLVAALASDDAAYVTGAFVPACGGALIF
ncbi:SDR family oxidoreductase [Amycolatopsis acidicola]|uniref:SDR family oxidoreductase n=1 Tax=Amycolatopsis acidicola TaxID=2596893 RepID=A0A5N0VJF3_9PSEU|nr:SDR family oxidoreductase [Amycolatopsis acidicola]KAA9166517.1 SDR family oxidoreductase [Amycolatopsis acidicola]